MGEGEVPEKIVPAISSEDDIPADAEFGAILPVTKEADREAEKPRSRSTTRTTSSTKNKPPRTRPYSQTPSRCPTKSRKAFNGWPANN